MTYDVVVVGSGLGGLSCGAALSAVGKRVLVLEKHHTVGGYIQSFTRKHWNWNVGVHYISDISSSTLVRNLFNALTDNRVVFDRLDAAYEKILSDDFSHEVLSNTDNQYLRALQQIFPKEQKQLCSFFKLLNKMRRRNGLLFSAKLFAGFSKYVVHAFTWMVFRRYWKKTVTQVLDRFFGDAKLKTILALHCDKMILHPDECSFMSWVTVHNSYADGACYPRGGGESITEALVDKITGAGGLVRVNAEVATILFEGGRTRGVRLVSGESVECDKVVSNAGIIETAETLVPKDECSPKQKKVVAKYTPSAAYMTLHLGFEGDLSRFNIENTNYRIYGKHPYDFTQNPLSDGWEPQNLIITFPSIRDKRHTATDKHSAEIICPVKYEHFVKWEKTELGHRGKEYRRSKENITAVLIASLEKWFPGISAHIAFTDLSTPLTFAHYTGHKGGAAYGLSYRVGRPTDLLLHPVSDIKGLYYTGADSLSQGIVGTFMSGVFTAVALSGKFRILGLT